MFRAVRVILSERKKKKNENQNVLKCPEKIIFTPKKFLFTIFDLFSIINICKTKRPSIPAILPKRINYLKNTQSSCLDKYLYSSTFLKMKCDFQTTKQSVLQLPPHNFLLSDGNRKPIWCNSFQPQEASEIKIHTLKDPFSPR